MLADKFALHLGGPLIDGVSLILYLLASTRDADVSLFPTSYGTSSNPHNTATCTSARVWPLAKDLSRRPLETWTEMKKREFASCCYFATVYSIILHFPTLAYPHGDMGFHLIPLRSSAIIMKV